MSLEFAYFDVGGTLIHPSPSVGAIYHEAGKTFGLDLSREELDAAFMAVWPEHVAESGRKALSMGIDDEETLDWWRRAVFRVFDRVGFEGDREGCFRALYAAFERREAWHVFEDTLVTLALLRKRGVPMGIISNWDYRLPTLLRTLHLAHWFEPIVVSALERKEKPDLALFEIALERAGVSAEKTLYVGDHAHLDVDPPRTMGISAFLIDRAGTSGHEHAVRSLTDLVRLFD